MRRMRLCQSKKVASLTTPCNDKEHNSYTTFSTQLYGQKYKNMEADDVLRGSFFKKVSQGFNTFSERAKTPLQSLVLYPTA